MPACVSGGVPAGRGDGRESRSFPSPAHAGAVYFGCSPPPPAMSRFGFARRLGALGLVLAFGTPLAAQTPPRASTGRAWTRRSPRATTSSATPTARGSARPSSRPTEARTGRSTSPPATPATQLDALVEAARRIGRARRARNCAPSATSTRPTATRPPSRAPGSRRSSPSSPASRPSATARASRACSARRSAPTSTSSTTARCTRTTCSACGWTRTSTSRRATAAALLQGGLSMPDRSYYLDPSPAWPTSARPTATTRPDAARSPASPGAAARRHGSGARDAHRARRTGFRRTRGTSPRATPTGRGRLPRAGARAGLGRLLRRGRPRRRRTRSSRGSRARSRASRASSRPRRSTRGRRS